MNSVSAINANTLSTSETAATAGSGSSDSNFSDILADTIRNQMTETVLTAASGMSSTDSLDYSSMSGGLETLLATAASTGEMSDLQTAILMLCMMMQSGEGSDFSPLMGVMASLFGALEGEDKEALYNNVMNTGYKPSTLVTVDTEIFGSKSTGTPAVTGTDKAIIPTEAWKPTTPAVTSSESDRSAEKLRAVINQFNVETAERYRPYRNGNTYCNIFVWDVTSAMGCEIPHYVDSVTGEPRTYPDIQGAYELDAAGIERWLVQYGAQYGWKEVSAEEAQAYANAGKAAVTTAGNIGHVQVVCPSSNGEFDPIRGVTVAQAGSKVYNYTYLSNIYSASSQSKIRYFVHE